MKTLKSILIITLLCVIGNGYIYCQTMLWDEYYTTIVFRDDFPNSQLDANKWNVENNSYRGGGVIIDSSATVSVNEGKLNLSIISCPGCTSGGETKNYAGGEVISKDNFQYGIFESRINFAGDKGIWTNFLLKGGNGVPCEQGSSYENEIDILDCWWRQISPYYTISQIIKHYHTGTDCIIDYKEVDRSNSGTTWLGSYHIYKCIWTPYYIRYYVDDTLVREVLNTGGLCPECNQEWFPEYPLHVFLYQSLITDVPLYITVPQTTYIDYVSVKSFFPTPEITCPELICTSGGTASLDVDSRATNISWSVSPSNLVTTSGGTGNTANLTAASSGASGAATITYTFEMPSGEIFEAAKYFWVGPPSSGNFNVIHVDTYDNTLFEGETNQLVAVDYDYQLGITDWDWDYDGWYHWEVTATDMLSFVDVPYFYNYKDIYVRAENTCGESGWHTERFYPFEYYYFSIFPNPASDYVELAIESKEEAANKTSKVKIAKIKDKDGFGEYTIEVWSKAGGKLKNITSKDKYLQLSTRDLLPGIYFVHLKVDGKIYKQQLIIEK